MNGIRNGLAALAAPWVVFICAIGAAAAPDTPLAARLGSLDYYPFGTVQRESLWRKPAGAVETQIPVCWENPSDDDESRRLSVQEAVETSWQAVALVRFTGWDTCPRRSEGIRIRINDDDDGPHVKALGRYLANRSRGMVLNFQFEKWGQDCQGERSDFCSRAIAIHEFGHALGFAHEQNRLDAPFECRSERGQGTRGNWNVTSYDPDSIMNYCNREWNNNGALSSRDIEAVTALYGARV